MSAVTGPWTILIPAPDRWITANDRGGRLATARRIREWRNAAFVAALQVKPPKGLDMVRVDVLFTFPKSPVRDLDNLRPTYKAVVDGAVGPKARTAPGYGIVVDDSDRHVVNGAFLSQVGPHTVRHPDGWPCHCGGVQLTITEVKP